jgi:hypothetical protein
MNIKKEHYLPIFSVFFLIGGIITYYIGGFNTLKLFVGYTALIVLGVPLFVVAFIRNKKNK